MINGSDWPTSETDVAAPFAAWMRSMDWDVYPEVQLQLSGRADMVGHRSVGTQDLYHAVEVKRRFGLRVLDQAIKHTSTTHYTSVVVPKMDSSSYKGRAAQTVLKRWGIGLYVVDRWPANHRGVICLEEESCAHTEQDKEEMSYDHPDDCNYGYRIKERFAPSLHRIEDWILDRYVNLSEYQKGVIPGNADNEYWTPWRETCQRVEDFVRVNPGCTTQELLDGVDHHYASESSARSSIPHWIHRGKIDVEIRKDGRKNRYYPPDD